MTFPLQGDWEPSLKSLLDLKHMGIPRAAVDEAVMIYRSIEPNPSSEGFIQFAYTTLLNRKHSFRLDWQPSPRTFRNLNSLGYTNDAVKIAAQEFSLKVARSDDIIVQPDSAFSSWIQKVYPTIRIDPLSRAAELHLRSKGITRPRLTKALSFLNDYVRVPLGDLTEDELILAITALSAR